jgi:uncharacterized protein (TIGR00730 family)
MSLQSRRIDQGDAPIALPLSWRFAKVLTPRQMMDQQPTQEAIEALVRAAGGEPQEPMGALVGEMVQTCLKLLRGEHELGQIRLLNRALKEMRHAYRVFNRYKGRRKISIFGSARTPETHPDYLAAHQFSAAIAQAGWMSITGAGNGIMKAGHEGPQRDASFGLSIRLPFETTANTVIEGDPKLINFRYFFTRKLMFLSHSDAVAVFPGGFGTQDELFEVLTLVQTGKSNMIPIVLVEGRGGTYWRQWETYIRRNLLDNGWISPEDPSLFHIASDIDNAVSHVLQFYHLYHSSRYVGEMLVLRLLRPLLSGELEMLNRDFAVLLKSGQIEQSDALQGETDHLDLPRLVFRHTRSNFGVLRQMIDRMNGFGRAETSVSR